MTRVNLATTAFRFGTRLFSSTRWASTGSSNYHPTSHVTVHVCTYFPKYDLTTHQNVTSLEDLRTRFSNRIERMGSTQNPEDIRFVCANKIISSEGAFARTRDTHGGDPLFVRVIWKGSN